VYKWYLETLKNEEFFDSPLSEFMNALPVGLYLIKLLYGVFTVYTMEKGIPIELRQRELKLEEDRDEAVMFKLDTTRVVLATSTKERKLVKHYVYDLIADTLQEIHTIDLKGRKITEMFVRVLKEVIIEASNDIMIYDPQTPYIVQQYKCPTYGTKLKTFTMVNKYIAIMPTCKINSRSKIKEEANAKLRVVTKCTN
jgi:hypothetical protein